jgi:glycosyltransferase involved in cell wall biosynthesis
MMVKVSVIIPTYNYANFIVEAIESILGQTYSLSDIEIIVVDDGSTDNTKEVLKPYIENGMVQYYFQKNKGKANATNFGVNKSTGAYLFNLDADDYFLPNKISETVAVFESDSKIVHVGTAAIHSTDEKWKGSEEKIPVELLGKSLDGIAVLELFYDRHLLFGGGSTFSARTSVLKQICIPDDVDMYIDEFLILAVFPFGKTHFIDHPLSVWRVHSSNYSGSNASPERKVIKGKRLLSSSEAVLAYLLKHERVFSARLIKIYQLIHLTREIGFKESVNKKTIKTIFEYAYAVFFELRLEPGLLKKHYVFNMLLPTTIHNWLRGIKHRKIN